MKTTSTKAAFFNSRILIGFALCSVGLLMALAGLNRSVTGTTTTTPDSNTHSKHHHYKLIDIGTFGGPESFINGTVNIFPPLNMRGMAVGGSATSVATSSTSDFFVCGGPEGLVPNVFHGFKLQNGMVTDLGALQSPTQNCSNAGSINTRGEIVGDSEIDAIDPLFGVKEFRAVLWKDGEISNLGTLGGDESAALGIIESRIIQ